MLYLPVAFDSPTQNPAPIQPQAGAGSQTPIAPVNTGASPVGAPAPIKPQGMPGAPAGVPHAPAPGAANPANNQNNQNNQISPDDAARYKAIQQSLYPDLVSALENVLHKENATELPDLNNLSDEEVSAIKDYLIDLGWDSTYLFSTIFKTTDTVKIKEFLNLIYDYQKRSNSIDKDQFKNFIKQKEIGVKQQEDNLKKQDQSLSKGKLELPQDMAKGKPAQPNLADSSSLNTTSSRGTNMAGLGVKDGKIIVASDTSAGTPETLTNLFAAIKEAENSFAKYSNAQLIYKGAQVEGIQSAIDEKEYDCHRAADVAKQKLSGLLDRLDEASEAKKSVTDIDTDKKFDDAISKGKDLASKGKDFFKKKEEPKPEPKPETPFAKKEEPVVGETPKAASILENANSSTTAVVDGAEKAVSNAESAASSLEQAPVKDSGSTTAAVNEGTVKATFSAVREKVSQLMPFKDKLKQTVDNTNEKDAKAQEKAISSDLTKFDKDKDTELLGMNRDKTAPTAKEVDKIKKSFFENGVAKARFAVDLACRQQVKGLLANPLKEAFVKEAVALGMSEESAKIAAHNAMISGYQASQEVVIEAAFDDFVKKPSQVFAEISDVTNKTAFVDADTVVSEVTEPIVKTASVEGLDDTMQRKLRLALNQSI